MENDAQPVRESGAQIHQRETRWQIVLPFTITVLILIVLVGAVAIQSAPIWRIRAETIADWTYSLMCLIPMTLCLMPLYVVVMLGIWGMNRLHGSTERPLRRLENLAANLAERIDKFSNAINQRTIGFNSRLAPLMNLISGFEPNNNPQEATSNEPTNPTDGQ